MSTTIDIEKVSLGSGEHSGPDDGFCAMELVAYMAGEPWSDSPDCVCPVLASFMRSWNDTLPTNADRDRLLKPLLPKLIGTRRDAATGSRRSWMCVDWYIREFAPAWLRLAKLESHAEALSSIAEIKGFAELNFILPTLRVASESASAARSAAWSAARSAAWSAAWSAARSAAWSAAESAARSAAWSEARSAAWSEAWSAAESAARSAAWSAAESAVSETASSLQESAVRLVERMIAA